MFVFLSREVNAMCVMGDLRSGKSACGTSHSDVTKRATFRQHQFSHSSDPGAKAEAHTALTTN